MSAIFLLYITANNCIETSFGKRSIFQNSRIYGLTVVTGVAKGFREDLVFTPFPGRLSLEARRCSIPPSLEGRRGERVPRKEACEVPLVQTS